MSAKDISSGLGFFPINLTPSVFIIINRAAFHSLLQKFLYPSILFKSKRTSLPVVAIDAKVKRNASVPNSGIPDGYSFFVSLVMNGSCLGFINPSVLFLISESKSIPSIKSIGSRILPLDLDIF